MKKTSHIITFNDVLENGFEYLKAGVTSAQYIPVGGVNILVAKNNDGVVMEAFIGGHKCSRRTIETINLQHNHAQHEYAVRRA